MLCNHQRTSSANVHCTTGSCVLFLPVFLFWEVCCVMFLLCSSLDRCVVFTLVILSREVCCVVTWVPVLTDVLCSFISYSLKEVLCVPISVPVLKGVLSSQLWTCLKRCMVFLTVFQSWTVRCVVLCSY